MAIYANLTGNNTTGSVFEFRSIKDGAYNFAKLSAIDFDLNNRTISNCPTITTNSNNITTNTNNIATNISAITAIQGVNTSQDGRLSNIETKTNKFTSSASLLDVNNTCSELRLNQNLNMNNNNILNMKDITCYGYSGYMNAYPFSTSMFNFDSILLGDTTNGSGFNFKCVKSGATKNLSIDYNNVNFNGRTLTNCSTIDTMASTIITQASLINTLQSQMSTVQQPLTAKCTIYMSGGNYAMTGQNCFRTFPSSGKYVDKISAGVISVLLDVNYSTALNANFVATMNGYKDTPLIESEQMIFCMNSPSAFYSNGSLIGYSFRIDGSRSYDQYNAFTDLGTNGRIHVSVTF
jgi:hypothetical protein